MAARIALHQAERPPTWRTLEVPLALPEALTGLASQADVVVVDCLNLWVANLLDKSLDLEGSFLRAETARLEAAATRPPFALIVVSNEVGWGVHPETALGRRFRDALGLVNQAIARAADEVVLMVAGCPVTVKPAPPSRDLGEGPRA
jgi:adenosylcobinamide kinase/adenosylcobinamide-phosphate guanylyltransferase